MPSLTNTQDPWLSRAERMSAILRHAEAYEGNNFFRRIYNNWRARNIVSLCGELRGKKILEVGIGEGYVARELKAGELWGVDLSPTRVAHAERNSGAHVVVANAEALPFENALFDGVVCADALEHMDHPEQALREMKRVVKPGGFLVISVPNEPMLILASALILHFPLHNPDHLQSLEPGTLGAVLGLGPQRSLHIPRLPYPLCVWQGYRFDFPAEPHHLRARDIVRTLQAAYPHPSFIDRLRLMLRPFATPFEEVLAHVRSGASVLDVGCGIGIVTTLIALLRKPRRLLGMDIDPRAIAVARASDPGRTGKAEFRLLPPLAFPEERFDVVTCVDVFHHVPKSDQRAFLRKMLGSLKPGGTLLLKDVTRSPLWRYAMNKMLDLLFSRQWTSQPSEETVVSWLRKEGNGSAELHYCNRLWHRHVLYIITSRTLRKSHAFHVEGRRNMEQRCSTV